VFFDERGDGEAMDAEEATDGADGDFTGKETLQAPLAAPAPTGSRPIHHTRVNGVPYLRFPSCEFFSVRSCFPLDAPTPPPPRHCEECETGRSNPASKIPNASFVRCEINFRSAPLIAPASTGVPYLRFNAIRI